MAFWKKKPKLKINFASPKLPTKRISASRPQSTTSIPKIKPDIPKKPAADKTAFKKVDARKEFLKVFKQLTYRHRAWDIWRDFIVMFACALSNPVDKSHYDEREKRYLKIIRKYNKQEQNLFPELTAYTVMVLEDDPEQDFLGSIFMELDLGNSTNGQFFTPYHICMLCLVS